MSATRRVLAKKVFIETINDEHTLTQLVDMAVETMDGETGQDIELDKEVTDAAEAYDQAVKAVLLDWVKKNMPKMRAGMGELQRAKKPEDIVDVMMELRGGAGYLYFMEAEGHGVGTWDGDWDVLFVTPKQTIKELSALVKQKTKQEYAKLGDAIENNAFKYVPEDDDE